MKIYAGQISHYMESHLEKLIKFVLHRNIVFYFHFFPTPDCTKLCSEYFYCVKKRRTAKNRTRILLFSSVYFVIIQLSVHELGLKIRFEREDDKDH